MTNTLTPIDVWLRYDWDMVAELGLDEEGATHEANTYMTESGYRVEWYLNSVGLVTCVEFDTLAEAHAWYEREGFQDFSS